MRFKEFIEEAINPNKGTAIKGAEKIKNLLSTEFSEALEKYKSGFAIFRGLADRHRETRELIKYADYAYFDAAKRKPRQSANTDNYYTLLLDSGQVPNWTMPRRGYGIICTSSMATVSHYGSPFVVLPANGAIIGICPFNDMWHSFDDIPFENLDQLNGFINHMFGFHNIKPNQKNPERLVQQLKSVRLWDETSRSTIKHYLSYNLAANGAPEDYISKQCKTLYDLAVYILSKPKKPFRKATIAQYNVASSTFGGDMGHEVWTEATCMLVKKKVLDEFIR